jgi:cobalt-zinc-cadmium efflux system membrane fusion protein
VVFVQKENVFEPRPVDLGRSDAVMTEIVGGLVAGDRYVAANSFILKAELGKGEAGHEH